MIDTGHVHQVVNNGLDVMKIIIPAVMTIIGWIGGWIHHSTVSKPKAPAQTTDQAK